MCALIRFFSFALLVCSPLTAHALSCASPQLNEQTLGGADIVFEGTVQQSRSLTFLEKASLVTHTNGKDYLDMRVYEFSVMLGWKGVEKGEHINILYNTYWGPGFQEKEATYLVATNGAISNFYYVHLCGLTGPVDYYKKNGQYPVLGDIFGGSE